MSKRRDRRILIPEARPALNQFRANVMARDGYLVNPIQPDDVKYEVARDLGVPLEQGYNGELKTKEAGKVGGQIGGKMVKELIRMAELQMSQKNT